MQYKTKPHQITVSWKLSMLCFFFLAMLHPVFAQTKAADSIHKYGTFHKEFSLLTGLNQGAYSFADIGLAINEYGSFRHPFAAAYFVSSEVKMGKDVIIGPKIGVWMGGGYVVGLNLIYYTDFMKGSFVFRPEIGIGIQKAKLVYGYNWKWKKSFNGIDEHIISLAYCFRLKNMKPARM
jgi:hypothetical protein